MITTDVVVLALLVVHIVAGFASLIAAIGAITTQWLRTAHRWHVLAGQVFVRSMIVIFLTAMPLAWVAKSLFLFLISIFSAYLAWSGYRYAKRRRGPVSPWDKRTAWIMVVAALGMIGYGTIMLFGGDLNGITLLIFGGLGGVLGWLDLDTYRSGEYTGTQRIANHLGMMLGGTIAAITAFVVTNFSLEPAFLLWIAPTIVVLPLITYWRRRVLN